MDNLLLQDSNNRFWRELPQGHTLLLTCDRSSPTYIDNTPTLTVWYGQNISCDRNWAYLHICTKYEDGKHYVCLLSYDEFMQFKDAPTACLNVPACIPSNKIPLTAFR